MAKYENPEKSTPCYRVLAAIIRSSEEETLSSLAQKMNMTQSHIQDVRDSLIEKGYVGTRNGKYNRKILIPLESKLHQNFRAFWDNQNIDVAKIKQNFLWKYVKNYTYHHRKSTIRRMLQDDFAAAVKSYHREDHDDEPEWLQELAESLGDEAPQFRAPAEFIEGALE